MWCQVFCLTLLLIIASVHGTDYCKICRGATHIACNNDGSFGPRCPAQVKLVELTSESISAIVEQHNVLRNALAGGEVGGFNAASRMATMEWDQELAELAALNVKTCQFEHDACHNTDKYAYSGQNLAYFAYNGDELQYADEAILRDNIASWWNEYKDTRQADVNSYPSSHRGPQIGHFTVMVAERNTAVGCAAVRLLQDDLNTFLLACNYATTNLIGLPIYESGRTASRCSTGSNPIYPNLCSLAESYELN